MKKFILLFLLAVMTPPVFAWILSGEIVDADGLELPGVSLKVTNLEDSLQRKFGVTDIDGKFSFEIQDSVPYAFQASMTGMQTVNHIVSQKDIEDGNTFLKVIMTDNPIMLQEAIVTATKAAVVAKQDTLEFNAGSFHTAPNATVGDLLKKLPGVEVSSDGTITSQGKTISKILVDGKEFFSDDPQMASNNLLSDMVDKIQVIDRKSDLARLTGVDDGEEETVINLTVKKDMQNGVFGNVGAGYGTDGRYKGSFVINSFRNGNQITLLGGFNNINENGFTDRGRGRFRDFGGSGGITNAQRLGLNFNVGKDEDFRVGGNILYAHTRRNVTSKKTTQYLFPDSVSFQKSFSESIDRGHNISSDFRLQWNIDPNNTLDFRPRFSVNIRDAEKNDSSILAMSEDMMDRVNKNLNRQNNKGTNFEIGGNLIFNHKFASHPGRSLSLNGQYSFSGNRQKGLTLNEIIYYLLNDEDQDLFRLIDNHTWANSVEARLSWTEPLGNIANGNFLNIAYKMRYQWNNADQLTYNLDPFLYNPMEPFPSPGDIFPDEDFDPLLSNRFRNKFFTQELQVGYRKVSKTLNLDAGLLFSPSNSKSDNLINDAKTIPSRWVYNVAPYLNVRYKFGERSSLRVNYRARTSQPTMAQLQPVEDVTDPLNVIIGNPELKPTFTQSIGAFLNDYRVDSQQAFTMMVNTSYSLNTIVSKTISDPETGKRVTTYGNVDGNFNIFGMAMLNQPFNNKSWRFNVRMGARFASTPGYINGEYNRTGNLNLMPSAGLTFTSDFFQMSINPTYSFGNVTNSLPQQANRTTHSYGFTSDFSVYFPFGVDLTTDLAFSNNTGYTTGFDSRQWLWNAQLSYSFLSDKSLTVAVKAYDILAMKKNISRSVSASSIIDSEYNALTRYVMLSLTWNFNSLRKKGKTAFEEPDIIGFPMPGPEGPGRGPEGGPGRQGGGGRNAKTF